MHGHLRNLLATPVTLCKGWQSGSKLTPAPYENEKAQTSEEKIYMQAVRSSRQLSTEVLAERLSINTCAL